MGRKKLSELPTKKLQLVLSEDEERRYREIIQRVERRNPYADLADINRRLLMIDKTNKLLTDADLKFFQGDANSTTKTVGVPVGEVENGAPSAAQKRANKK